MEINVKFDNIEEMVAFANTIAKTETSVTTVCKTVEVCKKTESTDDSITESNEDLLRLSLEEEAKELGVKFRSDIKTSTLQARIDKAKESKETKSKETTKEEVLEAALDLEDNDNEEDLQEFIKESEPESTEEEEEVIEEEEEDEVEEEEEEVVEETKPKRRRRRGGNKPVNEDTEEVSEAPKKRARRRRSRATSKAIPWES